ncbi:phosphoribosyl-AMP cyclohydrolase [Methylophilaceae bacterium]|nr:phosphoribosyl-AMP cyclohydrolase [Methylophilaceae bacterium]|tara:strand:- start:2106 stop:2504 length:399 start_codon:yes stop_codon:yes gene_type:complete
MSKYLDRIVWNSDGLLPVIVQDIFTNKVIMFAWMNKETLKQSIKERKAIYWSRSRKKVWVKGEESGNIQYIQEILLDCDGDTLIIKVKQEGGIACHTGRESCFYNKIDMETDNLIEVEAVIKDPNEIYKDKK